MMLTAIGLLLSMAVARDMTAVLGHDKHGQPALEITSNGTTHEIAHTMACSGSDDDPSIEEFALPGANGLVYH